MIGVMCGKYINICSAETFFWPEYLSTEKALPDQKISIHLKMYTEIEGIVRMSFDLMFKGSVEKINLSAEKNISSIENMSFEILEIRLSRKCYPPS